MENITVTFEHCSGGHSYLPKNARGFFDFYSIRVSRKDAEQLVASTTCQPWSTSETDEGKIFDAAERIAHLKMLDMVAEKHPDWSASAIDDLFAIAENHPENSN